MMARPAAVQGAHIRLEIDAQVAMLATRGGEAIRSNANVHCSGSDRHGGVGRKADAPKDPPPPLACTTHLARSGAQHAHPQRRPAGGVGNQVATRCRPAPASAQEGDAPGRIVPGVALFERPNCVRATNGSS
jgi:hypothetical protein